MDVTATERAYAHTKARILDGRLEGGTLISEGDVAADVGLSRTPVREAFLRLESEGLLRLYPRRGALVVPVSADEVEDVMETRRLVELHALDAAAGEGAALAARLTELIAEQARLVEADDAGGFVEADREFHRAIVHAGGNAILVSLHDSMRDRQSRMGLTAIARDTGRTREILSEHEGIAAALAAGDGPTARRLLEAHLDRTLALLRGRR